MKIYFEADPNVIIVDVLLKNNQIKKKIRMVLDTGAIYTMIPWEITEALSLDKYNYKNRIETITASDLEMSPLIKLPEIIVGNSKLRDVEVIVHDLPPKSFVDGLLGLSFLKYFNLNINFQESWLELSPY